MIIPDLWHVSAKLKALSTNADTAVGVSWGTRLVSCIHIPAEASVGYETGSMAIAGVGKISGVWCLTLQ